MSPRPAPGSAPASIAPSSRREPLVQVDLEVVTPMFGGVEPGVTDPLLPIRGPSIRGQLRFWWRACNAHRYDEAKKLFQDEAEIWGMNHRADDKHAPSSIDVDIQITHGGDPVDDPTSREYPAYALFPFRGQEGQPPKSGRKGVKFTLSLARNPQSALTDDQLRAPVTQAVWAWLTFGGIGARTRRGCGALKAIGNDWAIHGNDPASILAWIGQSYGQANEDPPTPNRLLIPVLRGATLVVLPRRDSVNQAWKAAVNLMYEFRQGTPHARTSLFGPSRWPEPDSIREIAGTSRPSSTPPTHPARQYFPRAELGLPIEFKFKDDDVASGDPERRWLEVAAPGATRMASPLILKPLVTASGAYPMVVLLNAPLLSGLGPKIDIKLKPEENSGLPTHTLSLPDDVQIAGKAGNVGPLLGEPNAREAFIAFVQQREPGAQERSL